MNVPSRQTDTCSKHTRRYSNIHHPPSGPLTDILVIRLLLSSSPSPTVTHFPLGGVHAEPCRGPRQAALTHRTNVGDDPRASLQYDPGPEVLHYRPRALWMSRVVNHCQLHITVCLGAAHTLQVFFFPESLGNYFQMLTDIKVYSNSRAPIIQSHRLTTSARRGAGLCIWLILNSNRETSRWTLPKSLSWNGKQMQRVGATRPLLCTAVYFFSLHWRKWRPGHFGLVRWFSITVTDL